MNIEMIIQNRDIQINLKNLEIEITAKNYEIENITVDGQEPSDIENMVIEDNIQEIQETVIYQCHEHEKYKNNEFWQEVHG